MTSKIYKIWINIIPILRGCRLSFFYHIFRSNIRIGSLLRVYSGREWIFIPGCSFVCGRKVLLGNNVSLRSSDGALLEIEDNVGIGNNSQIVCHKHIKIGKGTSIAPGVMLFDHNHLFDKDYGVNQRKFEDGEIVIGEHCWLGAGVIVVKDVTIGNNAIIGAGSVVVKDIPENCVAVGNPCKPIKYFK